MRCRRVWFMTHPKGKHSANIICIIMKTGEGRKYWLISSEIPDGQKKTIKTQLLENEAELHCYCDTNIVRTCQIIGREQGVRNAY